MDFRIVSQTIFTRTTLNRARRPTAKPFYPLNKFNFCPIDLPRFHGRPATFRPSLCTAQVPMSETDREALVALYNATGGASWNNNRNWNTDADLSKWHGVQADGDGRVVSLRLCNNNMQGIPRWSHEGVCFSRGMCLTLSKDSLAGSNPFIKLYSEYVLQQATTS